MVRVVVRVSILTRHPDNIAVDFCMFLCKIHYGSKKKFTIILSVHTQVYVYVHVHIYVERKEDIFIRTHERTYRTLLARDYFESY